MNYQESLEYLYTRLPVFHLTGAVAYKPGLDNTIRLMEALGNPHLKFKSVHVAGTNGKGSVSHILSAVLQESGYKTGLYTSPHLIDFGERIKINGQMVGQQFVIDFVHDTQDIVAEIKPSFFELTMAMAFKYFADQGVDIAIVEAGLGGRLDSTNILSPLLSIITNIGFDHVEFLGDSYTSIAGEKAGIIKSQTPVVIGEYNEETYAVFESRANELEAPVYFAQDLLLLNVHTQHAFHQEIEIDDHVYEIDLMGLYQGKNLRTALQAVRLLYKQGYNIERESLSEGLKNIQKLSGLRGRWEIVSDKPRIFADTAHNANGIAELCLQLKQLDRMPVIMIGMAADKDISSALKILPKDHEYIFTQADTKRAYEASKLQELALQFGLQGICIPNIGEALQKMLSDMKEENSLLITGSNFVVGEALEWLDRNLVP